MKEEEERKFFVIRSIFYVEGFFFVERVFTPSALNLRPEVIEEGPSEVKGFFYCEWWTMNIMDAY